jgi:hypothetical protein
MENPGFEDGVGDAIAGWSAWAWIGEAGVSSFARIRAGSDEPGSPEPMPAAEGRAYVRIESFKENDARLVQSMRFPGKGLYRISARIRADGLRADRSGASVSVVGQMQSSASVYDTNGEWLESVLYLRCGGKAEVPLCLCVGGYGSLNSGRADFDDIRLEPVSSIPAGAESVTAGGARASNGGSGAFSPNLDWRSSGFMPYVALAWLLTAAAIGIKISAASKRRKLSALRISPRLELIIAGIVIVAAVLVRFYLLGSIPRGLNQDEASIGYDSWAIGTFGIDRNGQSFPVYPIAWGAGHGPFYTYFALPFIKILGLSVFSLRLGMAVLGTLAVLCAWRFARAAGGRELGLCALFLLAVNPWAIISSRWALDANPLPFLMLAAVALLTAAARRKRFSLYALSMAAFGLCLYAYGSALVVVPAFLALAGGYLLLTKRISLARLLACMGIFLATILPLGIFLAINIFDLKPILTPWISFGKFTVMRSSSVFLPFDSGWIRAVAKNSTDAAAIVFGQRPDFTWNSIPAFGTMFLFSLPFALWGMVLCAISVFRARRFTGKAFLLFWFLASLAYALIVRGNINRLGIIMPTLALFAALALDSLRRCAKASAFLLAPALSLYALCFALFCSQYFGPYREETRRPFFDSLGSAVSRAMELTDGTIYVTGKDVNGSGMLALFYSKTPPGQYAGTVVYLDPRAEFRHALSFGRFVFALRADGYPRDWVYVISNAEIGEYERAGMAVERFALYSVAYFRR